MTLFYEELVDLSPLITELEAQGIEKDAHDDLILIVRSTMHHTVMDALFANLEQDHIDHLIALLASNEEQALPFVREKISDADGLISKNIGETLDLFLADLRE